MRSLLLGMALMAACRSAAQDITDRGGPQPIACIDKIKGYGVGIRTCRDGKGTVWVCGPNGDDMDCIPLSVVSEQWSAPHAEIPDGAH